MRSMDNRNIGGDANDLVHDVRHLEVRGITHGLREVIMTLSVGRATL